MGTMVVPEENDVVADSFDTSQLQTQPQDILPPVCTCTSMFTKLYVLDYIRTDDYEFVSFSA